MPGNKDQVNYWNSKLGLKWIQFEDELDAVFESVNQALVDRARPKLGENLLDIGCGTGATARAFSQLVSPGGYVTAVDISEPLLRHAKAQDCQANSGLTYSLLDAQTNAIPGGPFDLVISRFGAMFFADPVAAFANIRSHMKTGGRLAIAAWAPMKGNPWFEAPKNAAVDQLGPPDRSDPNAPGPLGFQNVDHVIALLEKSGFRNVSGQIIMVTLMHSGPLERVASLASNIGPAARILKKYSGSDADVAAITSAVFDEYRKFETLKGVRIPAKINFFEASNPG
ncbi:Methyltransferase domain-containing protein [Shimia gijangensis]|uniref:Methyltransferase domain-containing protein n=1 Tax=Shimia gijangensis TaxID=1470563 RepID=A0A1M6SA84_9RHOB|nr:class I SAM-dependent methyltransferase [Shimia gijangensis]SHK41576.1 Methyltransferase domain-containing protein [Shimia gijangensis]